MFEIDSTKTVPPLPPKCACHQPDHKDCGEGNRELQAQYHLLDIADVTDSVMKVMRICGLRPWEVKRCAGVIKRSLQHYEDVVQRIDRVPRKRFAKESFLHGLAHEGQMSRMDAQMAYSIVKRAFKAFYFGTGIEGRRYVCLADKMTHEVECIWLHAARRTAQIHAALAGLMYSEEMQFEERIECVYKNLFDVLKTRFIWADNLICTCGQQTVPSSEAPSKTPSSATAQVEVLYARHNMAVSSAPSKISTRGGTQKPSAAVSTASSRHNHILKKAEQTISQKQTPRKGSSNTSASQTKCNCPQLRCCRVSGEARESPEITAECSQGPYICRWLPYTEEDDEFPEHRVPFPPMEVVCPPCPKDDLSCDSECTCTCQVCTCQPEFDDAAAEEEEQGEKLSKFGVEDQDTDFCYVAPLRGSSVERMAKLKAQEKLLEIEEQQENVEDEDFQCGCTCELKQHAYPHLFTYLTPFRIKKELVDEPKTKVEPAPSEESSESEDLLSKPPPPGVTLNTYRCWVKPPSSTHSSDEARPPLVVVMGEKPKNNFQITIKEQNHSKQASTVPPAAPLPKAPVLPNKPAPTPAPAKPPPVPQKAKEEEDKLTKEDILDIIGLRFR
ncbi:uncharacterized protein LOC6530856 [Drosophila yakuba]|uniref:Uncharacterized protein n=1 Tax=Drosophila yakuba TaxID=7245 RepID=B4PAQ6_DROYA|nr:uncharacterized protein LOC6530856 [Drosophila yakuba]EDW91447.1 uncharacterized protein Dyak_GE13826 [Drosophila yakuba]